MFSFISSENGIFFVIIVTHPHKVIVFNKCVVVCKASVDIVCFGVLQVLKIKVLFFFSGAKKMENSIFLRFTYLY